MYWITGKIFVSCQPDETEYNHEIPAHTIRGKNQSQTFKYCKKSFRTLLQKDKHNKLVSNSDDKNQFSSVNL